MLGALLLPIDRHNPPTTAVMEQLNAVDPAHERFGIVRIVTGFVRAPYMRDVPELFGTPCNFLLVKSVLGKIRFYTRKEAIYIQYLRCEIVIRAWLGSWN